MQDIKSELLQLISKQEATIKQLQNGNISLMKYFLTVIKYNWFIFYRMVVHQSNKSQMAFLPKGNFRKKIGVWCKTHEDIFVKKNKNIFYIHVTEFTFAMKQYADITMMQAIIQSIWLDLMFWLTYKWKWANKIFN